VGSDTDTDADTDADTDGDTDDADDQFGWHTFYGALSTSSSVAVDGSGNIYLTGETKLPWDGPDGQSPLNAFCDNTGDWDFGPVNTFVLKLDPSGAYQWHTFYGQGDDPRGGMALTVDASGEVYVAGYTDLPWDGPDGQSPLNADGYAFLLKLGSDGAYQWHTFFGNAMPFSLALDGNGNVYAAGESCYPWTGPDGQSPLNPFHGEPGYYGDVLVLKLDPDGAYQWHTYYGAGGTDGAASLGVDGSGNVLVTGSSCLSWSGPSGEDPLYPFLGPAESCSSLILKLDANGAYQWHAFYGIDCGGNSIALDGSGSITVAGMAGASWSGPDGQSPLNAFSQGVGDQDEPFDLFVLEVDSGGAYQWHTFYGTGWYWSPSLAVDESGKSYVTGQSDSSWDGPDGQSPLHGVGGAYVLRLGAGGAYQWHAFYGSADDGPYPRSLAIAGDGTVLVAGTSNSSWFGPDSESPLHAYCDDATDFSVVPSNAFVLALKD
jgi:hypothetical protein